MRTTFTPIIAALSLPSLLMAGCGDGSDNTPEQVNSSRSEVIADDSDPAHTSSAVDDNADAPADDGGVSEKAEGPADAAVPASVSACAETEQALAGSLHRRSVNVGKDGTLLVASSTTTETAQLSHYSASGAPGSTISIPWDIDSARAAPDDGAVVSRYVDSYFIEDDGAQGLESSTYELGRVAPDGAVLWTVTLPGEVDSLGARGGFAGRADYDYAVGRDGTLTVMGDFTGTLTLGAGEETETTLESPDGGLAALIARYTTDGELKYAKVLDSVFEPSSLAVGEDGSTYAFGVAEGRLYASTQTERSRSPPASAKRGGAGCRDPNRVRSL